MTKKPLIIVESPAKIKTLKKFFGTKYVYESSIGHFRDLPEKEFGIDVDNDFEPIYTIMPDKKNVVEKLKKAAKEADVVYLSPDPDREGEAIAWHISQILPKNTHYERVSFHTFTKKEVEKALENPRDIDIALVNAQQARRLLDRIVGYKISPILNRRIQRGVSAGRVQSVALLLVVNREKEIEAFIPVEYWKLGAILISKGDTKNFDAYLYSVDGKKVEKEAVEGKEVYLIPNQEEAEKVLSRLRGVSYKVSNVERKEKKRKAPPPFITSTLQQEASRHFGYSSSRTMVIAQQLYEGIDLDSGETEGLITYMRTDSVRTAPQAVEEARGHIQKTFGKEFLPEKPHFYSTKKNSQDAHEAIRPANLLHHPEKVRPYLSKEQFNLYQLIWKRFIASQMEPAIYDTLTANISAGKDIMLRATGSVLKFPGYLAIYHEMHDEGETEDEEKRLPDLSVGEDLKLIELYSDQTFTKPPPRYTEASLVKELEKSGIGRPSTYASIMNKIHSREYTVKEKGRLKPTELGRIISQMLEENFEQIMDIDFTANMEDSLELVASNEKNWKEILKDFWKDFIPTLETAEKEAIVPKVLTDHDCPDCGAKLHKVWFKSKFFYGCTNYPDCTYTAPVGEVEFDKGDYADNFDWEQSCPKCASKMVVRHGKYGTFLGCSTYPDCKGIIQIPKKGEEAIPASQLPDCPAIGCPGKIMARRSRFGKQFYSCSTYPDCNVIVNSIDELETKYPDYPRTPYQKKTRKKGAKGKGKGKTKSKATGKKRGTASHAPVKVTKELQEFIGQEELPRAEILKKIWDYIKKHDLQDKSDKRRINPDDQLAKIFGSKEQVHMSKIMGIISKHVV